jgi:hypothetical protein
VINMDLFSLGISEVLRNYAIVFGGAVGLYFAWKRVTAANNQALSQLKQAELAQRVHVSDLFNRAVSQLADKKLEVRLGAILTFEQICRDYPERSTLVIRLLTTYLQKNTVKYGNRKPPADVMAIMDILREFRK